ncbi:MAG: GNAT family N-acetyltransferase [Deltaproteobacteria bacterium]|nr:GNAT family N-acetyltransferase [Deltaproteobacteria bacterium]
MDHVVRIDGDNGAAFAITVIEASGLTPELVHTILDIDLQTFAEGTFSAYTGAVFLQHGRVFLLRADEETIGTAVCMRSWADPREATLVAMGIRPGWRGQGLGQRFIAGVMQLLRSAELQRVSLMVGAGNKRAIRVYRDVGFVVDGEHQADPRGGESLLTMRATLR